MIPAFFSRQEASAALRARDAAALGEHVTVSREAVQNYTKAGKFEKKSRASIRLAVWTSTPFTADARL